jgi:ABC-2 type transport system permease protein
MDEIRAALAIARKHVVTMSRYRVAMVSMVFIPLYQGVIPAFLFGAAFTIGGRSLGLASTIGTENLTGFIFLGGVISGMIATAFWGMAMSLRNEQDAGTLEPSWLTPASHETFVIGRALGGTVLFLLTQIVLFGLGILFFGLRFDPGIVRAVPAVLLALLSMIGVAYVLAALVLLLKEANFFIDSANYLFAIASGTAFPVTLLPGIFQPIAFALPTTYAMDLLRHDAIGTRTLFDPALEYGLLILGTAIAYPLGRWAFAQAERTMRVRGTVAQY